MSSAAMESLSGQIKVRLKVTGLTAILAVLVYSVHSMGKYLRVFGNKTGKMVLVFLGKEI